MVRISSISPSYITVFTVRYVFTPRSVQKAAISAMSSAVKLALDLLRMFRPSMPKYTASAPACTAAASDSRLPTGAIISKSFLSILFLG